MVSCLDKIQFRGRCSTGHPLGATLTGGTFRFGPFTGASASRSRAGYRGGVSRQRRLLFALGLNVVLVVVQVVFGIIAHSLGLLADAAHNLTDVAAVALSLFAVRLSLRSPTARRSFGYHRSTILAAQANAAALVVVTALLVIEAIRRLQHPIEVHGGIVAVVGAIALLLNLGAVLFLHDHHGDLNMRSALLHMVGDAAASAGVMVAGVVIAITHGTYWLDPAVSIAIGLLIGYHAVKLLRDTTDVLLESSPAGLDPQSVVAAIAAVDGVESVHDLHAWSLSSDVHALSAHVVIDGHPSLEEAQVVSERVKTMIATTFGIGHATLELECEACHDEGEDPCRVMELGLGDGTHDAAHGHAHPH